MGALNLTVLVLNISPKASREDLVTFFSHCGTLDEIQLQRDKDQSQLALVTFRQPYAVQTALLLNDATILDHRVCILPLDNMKAVPIKSGTSDSLNSKRDSGGSLPGTDVVQAMASKSQEALSSAMERVSATGRVITRQATSAFSAAGQSVDNVRTAVVNNDYFSKGMLWLSGVVDKATKSMAKLSKGN